MPYLDAIILSAGRASRFGVPKFVLPAGPGEVLLTRVLAQALQVVDGRVAVVLGREAGLARLVIERWLNHHPSAREKVRIVENPNYAQGQSTSLKAGIQALHHSQGTLVFLADMPGLDLDRLMQLQRAIRQKRPSSLAVAPAEGGQLRPPIYLASSLFTDIAQLTGDQGARALLQARSSQVELLEWGSGLWFADVDTWEDYRYLARASNWASEPFVPLTRQTRPASAAEVLVDAALAGEIVPWLAPGLLLMASVDEAYWLELPQSYRGVRGIILGPAKTSTDWLQLVRRASLAALAEEN